MGNPSVKVATVLAGMLVGSACGVVLVTYSQPPRAGQAQQRASDFDAWLTAASTVPA